MHTQRFQKKGWSLLVENYGFSGLRTKYVFIFVEYALYNKQNFFRRTRKRVNTRDPWKSLNRNPSDQNCLASPMILSPFELYLSGLPTPIVDSKVLWKKICKCDGVEKMEWLIKSESTGENCSSGMLWQSNLGTDDLITLQASCSRLQRVSSICDT